MSADAFVWLFQDQMVAALEKEIDRLNVANGVSDAERASRSAARRDRILTTERAEEGEIERAAAKGTIIMRRPGADPRAVLNVQLDGASSSAASVAPAAA